MHVQVQILSKNMKGKHVQYVVWEHDKVSPDEIYRSGRIEVKGDIITTDGFTISTDHFKDGIDFPLINDPDKEIQSYFIEVIPLDVSAESIKFGLTDEKQRMEVLKSAAMVKSLPKKENKGTCICQEQYKDLIWGGKVSCEFRKKVIEICTELWPSKPMEMANGLMAVMNVETRGSFKAQQLEGWKSVKDPNKMTIKDFWKEGNRKSSRAIGLIQFTQEALQKNLKEYTSNKSLSIEQRFDELNKLKLSYAQMGEIKQLDKVKKYFLSQKDSIKSPEDIYLAVFAPSGVGKKDDYILYEGGTDEYDANASVDTKSKGKYKNDGDIQRAEILERFHSSKSEGERNKATKFTCGIDEKKEEINAKDIVTYHIYSNGNIEKHVPKSIKSGYEKKYKYVYHDFKNAEHEICIAEWHTTKEKGIGVVYKSKPTHAKIISDQTVSEGNTSRRVRYENGDVAEYGSHPRKGIIWLLYKAGKNDVELLRMPDSLDYKKENVNIAYTFTNTKRRFTGVNAFAGFIGYLAKSGYKLQTSGSCFSEGSSFPSQEHCNGRSVDTFYLGVVSQDQKVIDSAIFFHFTEVLKGVNVYCKKLKNAGNGGTLHDSHLHSGNFDSSVVKVIKEK